MAAILWPTLMAKGRVMGDAYHEIDDVLYAVHLRPHEFDLHRDEVRWRMRYAPIFDDPVPETSEHFKVLVLEARVELPPDLVAGHGGASDLELAKCGWQLHTATEAPIPADQVPENPDEVARLLVKIERVLNGLAKDAGVDEVLPASVAERLLADYQERFMS
jgi:hypothetical protein